MSKKERIAAVEDFASVIKDKAFVLVDYRGIDMPALDELRSSLYDSGAKFKVFKNTLIKRAIDQSDGAVKSEQIDEKCFLGMTAMAIAEPDQFFASGKSLLEAEKKKSIVIKGGVFEGKFIDAAMVRTYGSIPSRQDLYASLVGALEGILNKLVVVLGEVGEQKKSKEAQDDSKGASSGASSGDAKAGAAEKDTAKEAPKPDAAEVKSDAKDAKADTAPKAEDASKPDGAGA